MKPIYLKDEKRYGFREAPSLSRLMFLDYGIIYNELISCKEESSYKQRLQWLAEKGERLNPRLNCPFCRTGKAMIFAYEVSPSGLLYTESSLTSCHKGDCKTSLIKLLKTSKSGLVETRFSQILVNGRNGKERQQLGNLYRVIFGLPKSFTDQQALNLFENSEVN